MYQAESRSSSCGLVVHLQLLSTPPRGDAVTFGYGPESVCPGGTSHPPDSMNSQTHCHGHPGRATIHCTFVTAKMAVATGVRHPVHRARYPEPPARTGTTGPKNRAHGRRLLAG